MLYMCVIYIGQSCTYRRMYPLRSRRTGCSRLSIPDVLIVTQQGRSIPVGGWGGRRQRTCHLKLHVPTFRDKVNKNYIRVDQNLRRPPSPLNHTMSCWLHHDSISEVHVAIIIMVVGECFGAKGTTPCQESNLNIIVLCLS